MCCNRPGPEHEQTHDHEYITAVLTHMVHTYCAAMDIDAHVITIHGHEEGTCGDRLLTLHVATGPVSAANLALHSIMADMTSTVIASNGG